MTQIDRALGGAAPVILLLAFLVFCGVAAMCWRRGHSPVACFLRGLFAASLTCVLGVTLQPVMGGVSGVEIVPFGNLDSASGRNQAIGNLLLTAPSGLLAGVIARRLPAALAAGVVL